MASTTLQGTTQEDNLQRNDLIDTFLSEMWETLTQVQNLIQELQSDFSAENLQELANVFHKIKGTAALYQFKQISSLASLVERFSEMQPNFAKEGRQSFFSFLEQTVTCLRTAFESISEKGKEANLGLQMTWLGGSKLLKETLSQTDFETTKQTSQEVGQLPFIEELKLYGQKEQETLEYFVPEAREHLESLENTLFALREGQETDEKEAINELFRAAHTVKGAAYMVELNPLGDVSHTLEELMVRVRDEGMTFDEKVKQALNDGTKALGLMLDVTLGEDVDLMSSLSALKLNLIELLDDPTILPLVSVSESDEVDQDTQSDRGEQSAFLALVEKLKIYGQEEEETLSYFMPEALEHVASIDQALMVLGDSEEDFPENSEKLFRAAHTLKGAAAMVELEPLAEVAHALEDLSSIIREEQNSFDEQMQQSFFEGSRVLKDMLSVVEGEDQAVGESEFKLHLENFQNSLEDLLDNPPQILKPESVSQAAAERSQKAESSSTSSQTQVQKRSSSTIRVGVDKLDKLLDLTGNLVNLRGRVSHQMTQFAEIASSLDSNRVRLERVTEEFESQYLNPQLTDTQSLNQNKNKPDQSLLATTVSERFADLEFDTYNDLNILTRSISEMANDISELQRQIVGLKQGLDTEVESLQTLSRSLRTQVSRVRMVPIAQLFARLSRLLRQNENEENASKDFVLEVSGEGVEIDNAILEALADPLLHLVKNSLIHGIEGREERLSKGKDPQGKLIMTASYRGNSVIITVEDDGAGINVEAVKAKAVERGLLSVKEAEQLSPSEAMELIFLAGLSTAEKVTTEAGRGVGMDAVADTIRELKGSVSLDSEIDKGTCFTITLPLTLIISEVLLFKVAREIMSFPIESIYALQSLVPQKGEDGYYVNYEGKELPIYAAHELLALEENFFEGEKEVSVLFLRVGKELLAVAIDEFLALEEVVIKPLNNFLRQIYYLSGTTVISTGEVILMLDPIGLQSLAKARFVGRRLTTVAAPKVQTKRRLLLVDDSLSVRKVLSKKLTRLGFDIVTASDGQEAFDILLNDSDFDAILTDLEMPRLNGYELVESVRRRSETAEVPVIVMTTRARQEHMDLAFELGANDYLTKPVDETKLMKRLEEYL